MKGDERLERANKRTNEHLAKLVKANVTKAEAEKKAKLDKDMEVVPVKAVVNEMDEESMDDVWGYGLEADEWWSKTGRSVKRSSLRLGMRKLSTWWRS